MALTLLLLLQPAYSVDHSTQLDRGLIRTSDTQDRIALVIGNGDYQTSPLKNPVNDAQDLAVKLESLGFSVTRLINADQRTMERAVRDFTQRLGQTGTVGLFYFAGHGLEVEGQNYLVPIGAEISTEADVRYEAVAAGRLLDGMRMADNGLNLIVLDACRNNPYSRGFRSTRRGLADMNPASGTLVLYATEPGQVAADGEGRNGTFTEALLAALDEPGLTVEEVFKRTVREVREVTHGAQTPWQEGVILGKFYFRPSVLPLDQSASAIGNPGPPPPPPVAIGYLQLSTNAPGTRVWVAGRDMGTLEPAKPLNLIQGLPVGEVDVRASAPGYSEVRQTVAINNGIWTQLPLDLKLEVSAEEELSSLLAQCREHMENKRYTLPKDSNALLCYREVMRADLDNPEAKDAFDKMTAFYEANGRQALSDRAVSKVRDRIARLRMLDPASPAATSLEGDLARLPERQSRKQEATQQKAPAQRPKHQAHQVEKTQDARNAPVQGYVIPGEIYRDQHGRQCRKIEQVATRNGEVLRSTTTACKTGSGWKAVK